MEDLYLEHSGKRKKHKYIKKIKNRYFYTMKELKSYLENQKKKADDSIDVIKSRFGSSGESESSKSMSVVKEASAARARDHAMRAREGAPREYALAYGAYKNAQRYRNMYADEKKRAADIHSSGKTLSKIGSDMNTWKAASPEIARKSREANNRMISEGARAQKAGIGMFTNDMARSELKYRDNMKRAAKHYHKGIYYEAISEDYFKNNSKTSSKDASSDKKTVSRGAKAVSDRISKLTGSKRKTTGKAKSNHKRDNSIQNGGHKREVTGTAKQIHKRNRRKYYDVY